MLYKKSICIIVFAVACVVLGSCSARGGINVEDLTVISVKRPDIRMHDEMEPNLLNDIVINFTSARDLRKISEQYELNIGVDAYFCQGGEIDKSMPLQVNPYIFDTAGKIDAFGSKVSNNQAKHDYYIYISIKSTSLAGQKVFSYDLERTAGSICIRSHGGNMLGDKFTTNVISIPKENIISALASH